MEFGVVLFALTMAIVFAALIWHHARVVARIASERRQAEQALSEGQKNLASIIHSAMDAIITIDEIQRIILFNAAAEQMFQYPASEVLGQPIDRLIPERFRTAHQEHIRHFGRAGVTARRMGALGAISGVRADGQEFPIEAAISQIESAGKKFYTVILRDITQRKQAEQALREGEQRFRAMTETVPDILFTIRPDGRRDYVSPRFYQYTGLPPGSAEGFGWMAALHPEDLESSKARWLLSLKTGEPCETRHRLRAADGSYRWHLSRAHPIRDGDGPITKWFGVDSDIDDLVRTQETLIQAQKMEAVGQLTGGVAHDFNNLLTIISGNLQLLEEQVRDDALSRRLVAAAAKAAGRGADLVRGLLAFARRQVLQPMAVNLNQLIAGMMPLLHRTLGEHIEVVTRIEDRVLWPALADPAQVETALLNLAVNARDAMPQGGKLTIETANVCLDEAYTVHEVEVSPGDYVLLAVSDTGMGMSEDILKHAFEPFFTTKETGKGSGLGLSMVHGFAKQSRGHVKIYSEVGHGTTVKLYLPRAKIVAKHVMEERLPEIEYPKGRETVLVVEDEKGVRELAVAFLTALGYRVLEAADGSAALACLEEELAIDLLFVDLVLPGPMSGAELAAQALHRQPHLKVLYTSGYPKNVIVHNGRLDEGAHLLSKPYRREDLAHAVRRLLDATVKS